LTSWGKRKDGQSYIKNKRTITKLKKAGSTQSYGTKLPSKVPLTKNPFNTTNWSTATERYYNFKNKTNLKGFSFDPDDGIGYDLEDKSQAIRFYNKFDFPTFTGKPIYLVSLTNQLGGQLTRELHSNYDHAKNIGYSPLIGFWIGEYDEEYTDITIAMNATPKKDAIWLAKDRKQEGIVAIYNNGDLEYIPT